MSQSVSPDVAFQVREFARERLLDADSGFNGIIGAACSQYGVKVFQLSPGNLFLGRWDLPTLAKIKSPLNYPICVLSVVSADALGRANMKITPSQFSGSVIVSVDFYMEVQGGGVPVDGDAPFFAIASAMVGTFNAPSSYSLVPPGVSYNNEIKVDNGRLESDGTRIVQLVPGALAFYQIVD